ncbi:MAG TPA: phytanoyl-CoA dioxygenase family protein [Acidimicrobiales bacterium]|nr:phytanoyl-CoA dioxygenase family protein [Acidimicrobiales bacterium]
MSEPTLGTLEVANDLLGDRAALDASFQENGYLYFQGILACPELSAVSEAYIAELTRQDLVRGDAEGLTWTGRTMEDLDQEELHRKVDYDAFWDSPGLMEVLEAAYGGPVFVYKQTLLRVALPTFGRYDQPPHQDGYYVDSEDFRTVWVPLVTIPREVGGLAVARSSQRTGCREHVEHPEHRLFGRDYAIPGVPVDTIEEEWQSAAYAVGDLLIFHRYLVHRSQPNRSSEQVRISMDVRVQPVAAPRGYHATNNALTIMADYKNKGKTALPAFAK